MDKIEKNIFKKTESQNKDIDLKEKERIIYERNNQSISSRLAEYVTGLKSDDPAMLQRLVDDYNIIRSKYKLPARGGRSASEYERDLVNIAKKMKIPIRSTHERSAFFNEYTMAGGLYSDGKIFIDIDKKSKESYLSGLGKLEHELVHAMQDALSPSMPIEAKEYEAYLATINLDYLKEHPEDIDSVLFNFLIGNSVNHHYLIKSKKQGREIRPIWDNAEYFLKKDEINVDN